jgi:DNA mismatch repair ATPase MutS
LRNLAVLSTAINLAFGFAHRANVRTIVAGVETSAHDLALLSEVLARLEREKFSAPKLVHLQERLHDRGAVPSRSIARLGRLVELLISRRNPILQVADPFVLWTLNLAFAIEAWRKRFGPAVGAWISAVGEMEALSSLASYSYEHPADVFPEFTEDAPCFDAEAFAHPLIPESRAVQNDLRLDRDFRLMIVSGPNMAGKSTFLRSVGINAVLAQCGAPVRARRLRLSSLTVAASVCVLDSLQGGVSRFYAEIARLKLIVDSTRGPYPVLFLLDELLQGTNSHDRRIGAEAIARTLFQHGAIGLITTHDLVLAEIADSFGPGAANFHFEDRLENGKLLFDYHLTPGVVQTSNALDLMRSIGLDV